MDITPSPLTPRLPDAKLWRATVGDVVEALSPTDLEGAAPSAAEVTDSVVLRDRSPAAALSSSLHSEPIRPPVVAVPLRRPSDVGPKGPAPSHADVAAERGKHQRGPAPADDGPALPPPLRFAADAARASLAAGRPLPALALLDAAWPAANPPAELQALRAQGLLDVGRETESAEVAARGLAQAPASTALRWIGAQAAVRLDAPEHAAALVLPLLRQVPEPPKKGGDDAVAGPPDDPPAADIGVPLRARTALRGLVAVIVDMGTPPVAPSAASDAALEAQPTGAADVGAASPDGPDLVEFDAGVLVEILDGELEGAPEVGAEPEPSEASMPAARPRDSAQARPGLEEIVIDVEPGMVEEADPRPTQPARMAGSTSDRAAPTPRAAGATMPNVAPGGSAEESARRAPSQSAAANNTDPANSRSMPMSIDAPSPAATGAAATSRVTPQMPATADVQEPPIVMRAARGPEAAAGGAARQGVPLAPTASLADQTPPSAVVRPGAAAADPQSATRTPPDAATAAATNVTAGSADGDATLVAPPRSVLFEQRRAAVLAALESALAPAERKQMRSGGAMGIVRRWLSPAPPAERSVPAATVHSASGEPQPVDARTIELGLLKVSPYELAIVPLSAREAAPAEPEQPLKALPAPLDAPPPGMVLELTVPAPESAVRAAIESPDVTPESQARTPPSDTAPEARAERLQPPPSDPTTLFAWLQVDARLQPAGVLAAEWRQAGEGAALRRYGAAAAAAAQHGALPSSWTGVLRLALIGAAVLSVVVGRNGTALVLGLSAGLWWLQDGRRSA